MGAYSAPAGCRPQGRQKPGRKRGSGKWVGSLFRPDQRSERLTGPGAPSFRGRPRACKDDSNPSRTAARSCHSGLPNGRLRCTQTRSRSSSVARSPWFTTAIQFAGGVTGQSPGGAWAGRACGGVAANPRVGRRAPTRLRRPSRGLAATTSGTEPGRYGSADRVTHSRPSAARISLESDPSSR